jgi:translation initiation factor IF-3
MRVTEEWSNRWVGELRAIEIVIGAMRIAASLRKSLEPFLAFFTIDLETYYIHIRFFAYLPLRSSYHIPTMPPTHISGTSRALYRVFIAPTLRTPTSIPLLWAPAFASHPSYPSSPPSLTSHTTIRTKVYKKDVARHALTDHYVLDSAIRSNRINFVDDQGNFHPNMPLADALFKVNKTTHYLMQVTPGSVDEYGNQDPNDLPTCRTITKMALREQHQKKLDTARRQAKGLGVGPTPKHLELNWAIGGGDLKHRLGKLQEFLLEGRKVEVMLAPKKGGRQGTEEEANKLVKAVTETALECRGTKEVKSEGDVGGVLTLTFEGGKEELKKKKAEKEEKKEKRKEGKKEDVAHAP